MQDTNQLPAISTAEAAAIVATKTAPKLTKELIEAKIANVSYLIRGTLTLCIITMQNGFVLVGKAAPASDENFDGDVGARYAYDDAFKQIWHLEGYLLREKLAGLVQDVLPPHESAAATEAHLKPRPQTGEYPPPPAPAAEPAKEPNPQYHNH